MDQVEQVQTVDPNAEGVTSPNLEDAALLQMEKLAPRPITIEETGLGENFLADLFAKHLFNGGVLTNSELGERTALSGPVVEAVLNFMRREARIEVLGADKISGKNDGTSASLRYALTDRGTRSAHDAFSRGGYIGPAPVALNKYVEVTNAQSIHGYKINRAAVAAAFTDTIIRDELLDQLGPALTSGRAIFVYGPAGTGKTYITQKLSKLFPDTTLIPHAIAIGEYVIEVFDPVIHRQASAKKEGPYLMLERGHDPRFARCHRPVVIVGGELTADMLEIRYDASTRRYQAPLQLKANNGLLMIDDMGRQRVAPETVFNRWIVPLEEKRDYLSLGSGRHFSVPFDTVMLFSTNMHPLDLADEAFLRRIGYKIEFPYPRIDEFQAIWQQYCEKNDISCEPDVFTFLIDDLYAQHKHPMLPCHPRDLLGIAIDRATYHGEQRIVSKEHIDWAWKNYFVSMNQGNYSRRTASDHGGGENV
jgi:predicted ATPase with chaperone activity